MTLPLRRLWLTLALLGAFLYTPAVFGQRYTFKSYVEGLGNLNVNCITQDRAGFLWLGTENGLFRYDGSSFTKFGTAEGLPGTFVRALHLDQAGRLWVGTTQGLGVSSRDGKFHNVRYKEDDLKIGYYSALSSAQDGTVFAATQFGLLSLEPVRNGQSWTVELMREPSKPGLSQNKLQDGSIRSVLAMHDGSVVFGCGDAICRSRGDVVTRWGAAEGLPKDSWRALLEKRDGELWARGAQHIASYSRERKRWELRDPTGRSAGNIYIPLAEDPAGRVLAGFGPSLFVYSSGRWDSVSSANGLDEGTVGYVFVDRDHIVWLGMLGHGLRKWIGYGEWENWTHDQGIGSNEIWAVVAG